MRRPTPKQIHEHFCFLCHSMPSSGVRNSGGWWKCGQKPCVLPQSVPCLKHHRPAQEAPK